jgi:hypothetical protein
MNKNNAIPAKDANFNVTQARLRTAADANVTSWGLDPTWMNNSFDPAADLWNQKYAAYLEPLTRTKVITNEKNAAGKSYQPLLSMLIKGLRVNPRLTEDQKIELGLFDYDTTPSTPGEIRSWPVATITPVGAGVLKIEWVDSITGKRGKSRYIHGAEIRSGIFTTPPKSVDEIPQSTFATRTPHVIEYDQSLRGQTVYFCFRWEDTRGNKGLWSEIISAIIP